jgi:hypothetical protein
MKLFEHGKIQQYVKPCICLHILMGIEKYYTDLFFIHRSSSLYNHVIIFARTSTIQWAGYKLRLYSNPATQ